MSNNQSLTFEYIVDMMLHANTIAEATSILIKYANNITMFLDKERNLYFLKNNEPFAAYIGGGIGLKYANELIS